MSPRPLADMSSRPDGAASGAVRLEGAATDVARGEGPSSDAARPDGPRSDAARPDSPSSGAARPVVLITGAARRVGRAIALDLAAQGFDVAVHYRSAAAEAQETVAQARALGAQAQAFAADLADEAAARALVPAVLQHFKRLDAVVNNASAFEYDDVAQFSYELLKRMMLANTAPAVLLAQALHAHKVQHVATNGTSDPDEGRSGSGTNATNSISACVINLLDQKLWNPNPDYFSYTLSKAALEAATTLLAQALAPHVRVCGVAPGVTLVSGSMTPAEFERAQRMTPLGRTSSPDDVARTVRFLLQSPAITGTTVLVDGGQHLAGQNRDVLFLARDAATPTGK